MGLVNSVKSFMGYDDEEEDLMYDAVEEEEDEAVNTPKGYTGVRHGQKRKSNIVNMHQNRNEELVIMQPGRFEDTPQICDCMKDRKPVVVNIEQMDTSEAQRAIDFLCGAVCALDSKINKISNAIFVVVPKDMDISGDVREERRRRNSYSF